MPTLRGGHSQPACGGLIGMAGVPTRHASASAALARIPASGVIVSAELAAVVSACGRQESLQEVFSHLGEVRKFLAANFKQRAASGCGAGF